MAAANFFHVRKTKGRESAPGRFKVWKDQAGAVALGSAPGVSVGVVARDEL